MKVFVLLYCRNDEDINGNKLFFDTVRVGFPDAQIHVVDNRNEQKYRNLFEDLTASIDGVFHQSQNEILHSEFIKTLVMNEKDSFYLIDPDTIWLYKMSTEFDCSIAGRLIPQFFDSYSGCNTFSRLHTSCLYVNPDRTRKHISEFNKFAFDGFNDDMYKIDGIWYRHDTCGKLFHALDEDVYVFDESINNSFVHIFCGTHISLIKNHYPELKEIHQSIENGECDLRSLHKLHNEFFISNKWIKKAT